MQIPAKTSNLQNEAIKPCSSEGDDHARYHTCNHKCRHGLRRVAGRGGNEGRIVDTDYSTREALAMNRGITITERRGPETGPPAYRQFMVACLAGKVEGKPAVAPRIAAATQIPGKWAACEELAMQRGIEVSERRGTEGGPSPWRQFMVACLNGKIH